MHYDTFLLCWEELDLYMPVLFEQNVSGEIDQMRVQWEALLPPLIFKRKPDEGLRDERLLDKLIGSFSFLDKTFEIQKIIGSPIRESEVLMALGDTYAIDGDGIFMKLGEYDTKSDGFVYTNLSEPWQLGKHISSQSHEVIEFLYNVLNCSHE